MTFLRNFLKGYLTYFAGTAMILSGVGGIVLHFALPENGMAMNPHDAWVAISGGLVAIGLRRKQTAISTKIDTK